MATRGTLYKTLVDWASLIDPKGKVDKVVELLAETNEILDDAVFMEGNLPTGHRSTIRTGLPSVTWRKLNYGVQPSKSTTAQVDDTVGMCEALSQIDESIARLNGNSAEFRLSEDRPFLEKMNQEMAGGMFYFDTDDDPEKFLGLVERYPYSNSENVIATGGTGSDTTSIWLVVWGPNTVFMIFPKGSKAGIEHRDVGGGKPVLVDDAASPAGKYWAFQTHYKWDIGMVVRDWRYVVRVVNVESTGSSNIFDPNDLITAYNLIPQMKMGRAAIYCNGRIKTQMDKDAFSDSNRMYTVEEDAFGFPITKFWGIPIRKVDQILNTETAIQPRP
jgi:hypothetical protein